MMSNVGLNSAAVSLLTSYNNAQTQLDKVQNAVSTGYDVSKSSDNPLFYEQAQVLRGQANDYNPFITKLTQAKTSIDKLQSAIQTISDTATKIQNLVAGLGATSTAQDEQTAAVSIKSYLTTIQNLINASSTDPSGFILNSQKPIFININPQANAKPTNTNLSSYNVLSLSGINLNIQSLLVRSTNSGFAKPLNTAGLISFKVSLGNVAATTNVAAHLATTNYVADLSAATNRANFLNTVTGWIQGTLNGAAANVGAFANALDASLQTMQTEQAGFNAEADALTKTDLTKDSAQSTALATQQQLLTSLLSMSNQRMSTVLSLFR